MIINRILILTIFFTSILFLPFAKDPYIIKTVVLYFFTTLLLVFTDKIKLDKSISLLFIGILVAIILSGINSQFFLLTVEKFYLWFCYFIIYISTPGLNRHFPALNSYAVEEKTIYEKKLVEDDSDKIIIGIGVTALICIIYGILQYFGVDFVNWQDNYGTRIFSSIGNPNFYAGFLLVSLPMIFYLSIKTFKLPINTKTTFTYTKKSFKNQNFKNSASSLFSIINFFWLAVVIFGFISLILTQTRGAIIAVIVSFIIIVCIYFAGIKKLGSNILAVVIFAIFLITAGYSVNSMVKKTDEPSIRERFFKWFTGYEMFKDDPLIGIGAGNLKVDFAIYQSKVKKYFDIPLKGTSESNVHNEYVQTFAETGVIGGILFVSFFIMLIIKITKLYFVYRKLFHLICLVSAMNIALFSLTNFPFSIIPTGIIFFTVAGLSLNHTHYSLSTGYKYVKYILLLVSVIGFIYFGFFRFVAEIYKYKADISRDSGKYEYAIKHYTTAIKYDRLHSERTAYDLAEVYRKMGNINKAIKYYLLSTKLRNYGEVYNNLGNCFYLKKDYNQAIFYWEKAVEIGLPSKNDLENTKKNLESVKKIILQT